MSLLVLLVNMKHWGWFVGTWHNPFVKGSHTTMDSLQLFAESAASTIGTHG